MNVTEEQYKKMGEIFEAAFEYATLVKEHNSAKTELFTNFLDDICPKPSGKMNQTDKEKFKELRKEAKQFISDTYRLYLRDIQNTVDTTPEALIASEKISGK
jgi:hypothetical protein